PQNVGQGLQNAGNSIIGALLARKGIEAQEARTAATNEAFAPILAALTGGSTGAALGGLGSAPGAPLSLAGPRQAAPGAEPTQLASAGGGAGFSTGGAPGMDRNQALAQILSNPDLLRDPRAQAILPLLMPQQPDTVSADREAQLIRLAQARPGTSINVDARGNKLPPPPSGFMYEAGPSGETILVAIPGGPAATEAAAGEEKAATAAAGQLTQAELMTEEIGRARELAVNQGLLPNTGAIGKLLATLNLGDANDLGELLTTLSANLSFDRLQQMRDASTSGAALGAISERELDLLSASRGSLEQSQGGPQLVFNLDRMARTFNEIVHGNPEGEQSPQAEVTQPVNPAIAAMTIEGLTALDMATLSDAELAAARQRFDELNNAR
ncbi:MAG: hypothetical protein ABUJ98_12690, partial [Hyphomicrobium sp.]